MDIDLLEKVFYYHIEKTLDKDQCRSRCLEMVEAFAYDLENQKADRLLEIGVMIEAVISNNELLKIKVWADTL